MLSGNNANSNKILIGYAYGISISSSSNLLYQNNLINNDMNALNSGQNQWDNGIKGNYYSDYNGIDSNNDGIGDTPYNVSGSGGPQDRYPLMQMYLWSQPPIIPFPDSNKTPTDPDSDGLYEDINGNGRPDFNDVVMLFNNLEWITGSQLVQNFDFNGNGWIDFNDIIKLFEEL